MPVRPESFLLEFANGVLEQEFVLKTASGQDDSFY
jgi:hypothetical protein